MTHLTAPPRPMHIPHLLPPQVPTSRLSILDVEAARVPACPTASLAVPICRRIAAAMAVPDTAGILTPNPRVGADRPRC